jgi:hypothetical protein
MPYVTDRFIHDADSHFVETPEWLDPYLDSSIASRVERRSHAGGVGGTGGVDVDRFFEKKRAQQADPCGCRKFGRGP